MTLPADIDRQIDLAAEILRAGGLVAFPTETVYGLGADADQETAVRKIFAAKGRPADHPLIVHLLAPDNLRDWAVEIPPAAWILADAFWPGPLTIILKRSRRAKDVVTGGLDTVGLRVPRHPVARELLVRFGGAIAAPSANRFGRVSPTTAEHVGQELGDRVELILDGGDCEVGLESTIVDLASPSPAILRPGYVTSDQIEAALGRSLRRPAADAPRSPGALPSHYAPRARVEVVADKEVRKRFAALVEAGKKTAVLGSRFAGQLPAEAVIPLPDDFEAAARGLYAALREADQRGCDVVLVTLPPEQGLGTAIADRLRKAAGPRDDDRP